jgi:hypothetical protein
VSAKLLNRGFGALSKRDQALAFNQSEGTALWTGARSRIQRSVLQLLPEFIRRAQQHVLAWRFGSSDVPI